MTDDSCAEGVPVQKACTKCGKVKPLDEFSYHPKTRDGRQPRCRACCNERERLDRLENPERYRVRHQKRRVAQAAHQARYYAEDCEQVFGYYGEECACCGATEQLEVDHVGGGGNQHRDELTGSGSGIHLYRWLIKNDFPPGFQVLCRPCNRHKGDGERCWLDHSEGAPSYREQMRARNNAYRCQYNKDRDVRTGYRALHLRLRAARGRAADYPCARADGLCSGSMQWANISRQYLGVDDFMPLCRYHHRRYDQV